MTQSLRYTNTGLREISEIYIEGKYTRIYFQNTFNGGLKCDVEEKRQFSIFKSIKYLNCEVLKRKIYLLDKWKG